MIVYDYVPPDAGVAGFIIQGERERRLVKEEGVYLRQWSKETARLFGEQLHALRRERNLKLRDVVRMTESLDYPVYPSFLDRLERGLGRVPLRATVNVLASVYGVDADDLYQRIIPQG